MNACGGGGILIGVGLVLNVVLLVLNQRTTRLQREWIERYLIRPPEGRPTGEPK